MTFSQEAQRAMIVTYRKFDLQSLKETVPTSPDLGFNKLTPWDPGSMDVTMMDEELRRLMLLVDPISVHGLESRNIFTVMPSTAFVGGFDGIFPSSRLYEIGRESHYGTLVEELRRRLQQTILGSYLETKHHVWAGHKISGTLANGVEASSSIGPGQFTRNFIEWITLQCPDNQVAIHPWTLEFVRITKDEMRQIACLAEDPRFGEKISKIMDFTHMSDGWRSMLENIIRGRSVDENTLKQRMGLQDVVEAMVSQVRRMSGYRLEFNDPNDITMNELCAACSLTHLEKTGIPTGAVVVEINPRKVYERKGYGIGSKTKRPSTTVMLEEVLPSECTYLFVSGGNDRLANYLKSVTTIPVGKWTDLSESSWAGGQPPERAHLLGPDFWSAFHGSEAERESEWEIILKNGLAFQISYLNSLSMLQ